MKRLEQLYTEMTREIPFVINEELKPYILELAQIYAREVAQASLKKAAKNAELGVVKCEDCKCQSNFCTDNIGILEESITNPNNIILI